MTKISPVAGLLAVLTLGLAAEEDQSAFETHPI